MTSVSSSFGSFQPPQIQGQSPKDRLHKLLDTQVSSGAISSEDGDALSTAIDTIDKALTSEASAGASSGTRPDPSQFKSKIDDLISSQVKDGKLTDDQASELKDLLTKGGPGGAGGPPPGFDLSQAQGSSDSSDSSGSDDLTSLLQDFLKELQSQKSSSGYDAGGSGQSSLTAILLDYQA